MSGRVVGLLRRQAKAQPDGLAVVHGSGSTTWAELHRNAIRTANALRTAGVAVQERVAFVDKNGIEFFEFLFGCALCGAVPVPISWRFTAAEMAATIADADVRLVLAGSEFVDALNRPVGDGVGSPACICLDEHPTLPIFRAWIADQSEVDPDVDAGEGAVAMQLYTSGTTGLPKGVLIDERNLDCLLDAVGPAWDLRGDDVSLVCMPLFHMGGVAWALAGMAAGCRSVLVREFAPVAVLDLLLSQQVTIAFFVPAMLSFLCAVPDAAARSYALRRIVYSGSPITEEALRRAMATFGCDFAQIYGMSETTGSFAQLEPADHATQGPRARLLRSAGRPYPWVQVRIVDSRSGAECAAGAVGEICTLSAQNTRGYWNNSAETAALLREDGWLRTGDAGYRDDQGYLFLTDRIKDMIISGGENVYPAEVENVLASHPAVAEVAVIGVPSEKWGETVKAVIAVRPGVEADAEELIAHARGRLAGFKCPTSVDFVPTLPRSPTGKVLKKDLREPHWRGRTRRIN